MILLKKRPHLTLKIPLAVMRLLSFDITNQRPNIRRANRERPIPTLPSKIFDPLPLHPLRRIGFQCLEKLRQANGRMQSHAQVNMVRYATDADAITRTIAHNCSQVSMQFQSDSVPNKGRRSFVLNTT